MKTIQQEIYDNAFNCGYLDYFDGRNKNPYTVEDRCHQEWKEGWTKAAVEDD